MRFYHRYKYRLLTLLYSIMILIVNSTPGNRIPRINIPHFDKIVHFGIYFLFGFLLLMAVIEHRPLSGLKSISISFTIGLLFGLLDEVHQLWIPRRFMSMADLAADAAGLFLGIMLMFLLILQRYVKVRL